MEIESDDLELIETHRLVDELLRRFDGGLVVLLGVQDKAAPWVAGEELQAKAVLQQKGHRFIRDKILEIAEQFVKTGPVGGPPNA